jgi:hypothetical protein
MRYPTRGVAVRPLALLSLDHGCGHPIPAMRGLAAFANGAKNGFGLKTRNPTGRPRRANDTSSIGYDNRMYRSAAY